MRALLAASLCLTLAGLTACNGSRRLSGRMPVERTDAGAAADAAPDAAAALDAELVSDSGSAEDASADAGTARDAGVATDSGPVTELPTGTPAADEARINETVRHQTMDGVGVNSSSFPIANDLGWSWENVRFVFDELRIRYVRLVSWFEWWETRNDNADPNVIDWSGFQTVNRTVSGHDVPFLQYLAARGIPAELGVWNVGDWLASGNPRRIDPANYPELGESITSYHLFMRDNGIELNVAEVQNEPGIQARIQYASPENLRDAALALLDQLDRNGLSHVMLHGPNYHQVANTAAWAQVWLADQRLRDRTIAVSYHTWWQNDFASFDSIRRVAEAAGKPVWATEMGYCALPAGCGNGHFLRPETWATAWDYALSYYRAIAWSRASRLYHWSLLGFDTAVSPMGERRPSFYVLKQFTNYLDPASRYLESASGDPEVLVLPFLLSSGELSVILLNTGRAAKRFNLVSVRGSALTLIEGTTTREGSYDRPVVTTGPDARGRLQVELGPESITSLRLRP